MSVSAETPQPQPGDRVRVTPNPFEGEMVCDGSQGRLIQVRDEQGRVNAFGPDYATVEVLERADDPSKDPIDTVRVAPDGTIAVRMHVSRNGDRYTPGWRLLRGCVEMHDNGVVGWRVIGSLSEIVSADHLPARPSVRVPNEPHGIPNEERERVAVRLVAGDMASAVRVLTALGMSDMKALSYVRDMPEYQAYLAAHGEPEGVRTLHVHPHVWKALVTYLVNTRVRVVPSGVDGTYVMELMDGEWP